MNTKLNKILIKPLKTRKKKKRFYSRKFRFYKSFEKQQTQQQQQLPRQQAFSIHEITSVEIQNVSLYVEFKSVKR